MARDDHPPSFQFYPRDYISDPAVRCMNLAERGAYVNLLCAAWWTDGILPDDDAMLASLSESGSDWPAMRPAIARAFVVLNGEWRQKRMISERKAQKERYRRAKEGADATNEKRWGNVAERHDSESLDGRVAVTPASASASASDSKSKYPPNTQSPHGEPAPVGACAPVSASPEGNGTQPYPNGNGALRDRKPRPPRPEAEPILFPDFYSLNPRHDGRRAAAKAFASALKRHPEYTADDLIWAVEQFAAKVKREGIEERYIPMPATWLNQDRFREFFDEEDNRGPEA